MNRQTAVVIFVLLVLTTTMTSCESASKCNFASRRLARLCKRTQRQNRLVHYEEPAYEESSLEETKSQDVNSYLNKLFRDNYQ